MTAKEARERAKRNTSVAKEVALVMEKIAEACDEGKYSTYYLYSGDYTSQVQVMTALRKEGYYVKENSKDFYLLYIDWNFP